MQGGALRDRFTFSKRADADNGAGTVRGAFVPQFTVWCNAKPLNGGEEVMAARLSSQRTVLVSVRSSSVTRAITTDWAAKDARTGDLYNIVEVKDPDSRRQWVEVLCRSGVVGGGVPGEQ